MAEEDHPCAGRDAAPKIFYQALSRNEGHAHRPVDVLEAALPRKEPPCPVASPVFMVGCQHLIIRPQRQGPRHDVDRDRDVLRINQIVRVRFEIGGQGSTGRTHQAIVAASQELHRLALEFSLPALIFLEDFSWGRTKGPVI